MPIPQKNTFEAPKSAKIRIYETLREWIIDGTLQPGEKILDSELSQYFSVSRTPVREAIQMLAEQKLIDVRPGRESRISEIDVTDIPQTYKMLAELHSTALEFAFAKISSDSLDSLRKANERFMRAYKDRDIKGCRSCDNEFHDIIVKLAGNDFLTSFIETLGGHASRFENIYFSKAGNMDELIHQHSQIINAIEDGDLEKAKSLMQSNWLHTPEVITSEQPAQ
jgi:DNA-binding GntR family transcriptional regulator